MIFYCHTIILGFCGDYSYHHDFVVKVLWVSFNLRITSIDEKIEQIFEKVNNCTLHLYNCLISKENNT